MALMGTDKTITQEMQDNVLLMLSGGSKPDGEAADNGDAVWSREKVAARIGKGVRVVDLYGQRGIFKRVYFTQGKSRRAVGYSRRSVMEAIANGIS